MENLYISAGAVFPLFIYMLIGYIAKRLKVVDNSVLSGMNVVMFKCFLPMLLFKNIYSHQIYLQPHIYWFSIASVTLCFTVLSIIVPKIIKTPERRGAVIQGIMRSNSAIYGLPIATALLGETHTAAVSMVIASVVIPFNAFSIITLEINRAKEVSVTKILKQILINPLIIAIVAAICFNALNIKIPLPLVSIIEDMGDITTPFAFFVLGAFFTFSSAAKNRKTLLSVCLCKLIIVPFVFLTLAIILGMRDLALVCILVVFAPPTAVSSFPMAGVMESDAELAGEIVVFTSALSILTVFAFIFILKTFAFI